mmetsp:Transcript_69687/g.185201  ORF Transcript_69687/g.185201 Transcript_69687/m.185201 type:complete len:214 (+) Transcript_69687:267-908(+)
MACARSEEETTPTTSSVTGEVTTRWWREWFAMIRAAWASHVSEVTIRGCRLLWRPRNQCPTVTSNGTCSAKARSASRGVMTPCGPGLRPASSTSAQFCRARAMSPRAWPSVPPLGHTGRAARGFMTSATAAAPILLSTSSRPVPPLQSARTRSSAERTPRSPPDSSRTTRCRQEKSPRASTRSFSAASQSGVLLPTVMVSPKEAGQRARSLCR